MPCVHGKSILTLSLHQRFMSAMSRGR